MSLSCRVGTSGLATDGVGGQLLLLSVLLYVRFGGMFGAGFCLPPLLLLQSLPLLTVNLFIFLFVCFMRVCIKSFQVGSLSLLQH